VGFFVSSAPAALAQPASGSPKSATPVLSSNGVDEKGTQLGTGDRIKLTIFGQPDLSGEFMVDGAGFVQLPLVGQVKALGKTVKDFEKAVAARFSDGYLVNPSINIDVINFRPFYIIGEVNRPGEYSYVDDMTVLNAVALAGGYTTRANDSEAYIRRKGAKDEVEVPADESIHVEPGDTIRIGERFF